MTPKSPDEETASGRFSGAWEDLLKEGQAPELGGRTVREAAEREESKGRRKTRPMQPTEQRRRRRKITPALPRALVADLRRICKDYGWEAEDGGGMIVSTVISSLLSLVIRLYQAGQLELVEEEGAVPVRQLRCGAGETAVQVLLPQPRPPDTETISPTLPAELISELRAIGQDLGYTDGKGHGVVAASVIQLLLCAAVDLHDRGLIETAEDTIPVTTRRLSWKARRRAAMPGVRQ